MPIAHREDIRPRPHEELRLWLRPILLSRADTSRLTTGQAPQSVEGSSPRRGRELRAIKGPNHVRAGEAFCCPGFRVSNIARGPARRHTTTLCGMRYYYAVGITEVPRPVESGRLPEMFPCLPTRHTRMISLASHRTSIDRCPRAATRRSPVASRNEPVASIN